MTRVLSIGEAARLSGTGIETIRFYEREGLIEAPRRKQSGYREFEPKHIRRLQFIRQAKALGFSLAETKELLSIREDPTSGTRQVKALARSKLLDIQEKIRMLQRMRKALKALVDSCPGEGPKSDCPIIEALES